MIKSINPYTNKLNAEFDILTQNQIIDKIESANLAFREWKNVSNKDKARLFLRLSEIMHDNREELALFSVLEVWMTYLNAMSDVKKTIAWIKWVA